ncbi:proline-, glutamic acid- and leucine-rich protein 1-like [Lytechinus pictus]|uniref:proline-, glutamic acid- and leucine-rich protein 1-like n=1 Tax=Lytechinus pictus TaxID=7653 RepID=UPI0030B9D341
MEHKLLENASKLLQQNVHGSNAKQTSKLIARHSADHSVDTLIFSGKKRGTLHDWISQVNANLSTSASRLEGLVILRAIIQQCSQETFSECCVTWVRLLISIFQPHQTPSIVEIASGILVDIFKAASSQSNEITRDLAINHIPGLLGTLLNAESEEWLVPSLRLLAVCMECFPGPCGAISYKLEAMITPHLDSIYPDIQKLAQTCYPLLARLGGGGSGGIKYTEAFKRYSMLILNTLRTKLAVLYEEYASDLEPSSEEGIEPISLSPAPTEEPMRTLHLTNQIESLTKCLQIMLRNEFPAKASIPVKSMLDYISSALDVTGKTLDDHVTSESSMLALVLPRIHQATLQLLKALIESCCINHYNHQINQIFLKMLGWTHSQAMVKPFRNLRAEVYRTIGTWLKTAGVSSGFAAMAGEKLIHQCIQDATPPVSTTKLTSGAQAKSEKKGGKVKVKGQSSQSSDLSSRGQQSDQYLDRVLCLTALQALRQLMLTSGVKLKANLHQDVYQFIIPLLTKIQSCDSSSIPSPYTCCECRKELYGILQSVVLVPHPQAPSPLNLAVAIFKEGKNDRSIDVSSACREAAVICDTIIHPRRPPVPCAKSQAPPTSLVLQAVPSSASGTSTLQEEQVAMETEDSGDKTYPSERIVSSTKECEVQIVSPLLDSDLQTVADEHRHVSIQDDAKHNREISNTLPDSRKTDKASASMTSDVTTDSENENEEEEVEEKDDGKKTEGKRAEVEEKLGTSSRKRKQETSSSLQVKKPATEEVESMLSAFIDAPPDED